MKSVYELTVPLYTTYNWHTSDPHARPVLIRMREGAELEVVFFIENEISPAVPGGLSFQFYALYSGMVYPNQNLRYFSSCLSPDGTQMVHGLYQVVYASAPSRITQPELPGPAGPPGPMGPMSPGGPIGVTWTPST